MKYWNDKNHDIITHPIFRFISLQNAHIWVYGPTVITNSNVYFCQAPRYRMHFTEMPKRNSRLNTRDQFTKQIVNCFREPRAGSLAILNEKVRKILHPKMFTFTTGRVCLVGDSVLACWWMDAVSTKRLGIMLM